MHGSVCLCLCSHVFSRNVAAADTKRGYVGMCNGRSAQQESGAALSCLRLGPKIIYSYYTRCALIRDRRPTAWDGFARPAGTEATCIWKVSPQIVVGRFFFTFGRVKGHTWNYCAEGGRPWERGYTLNAA